MPSTLAEPVYCEIEIKKSRFLTWLEPVASSEDAKARLDSIRKQYPDARHVCFAFYVNGSSGLSDDGEPSGTAAKPMFNVIAHNDLINVMAIVVRYFGGIKLGAGGLARAYGGAVAQAMTLANVVKVERKFTLKLTFDFALESQVRRVLVPFSIELENIQYTSAVSAVVTVSESTRAEVLSQLQSIAPGSSALIIDCDEPEAGL